MKNAHLVFMSGFLPIVRCCCCWWCWPWKKKNVRAHWTQTATHRLNSRVCFDHYQGLVFFHLCAIHFLCCRSEKHCHYSFVRKKIEYHQIIEYLRITFGEWSLWFQENDGYEMLNSPINERELFLIEFFASKNHVEPVYRSVWSKKKRFRQLVCVF